MTVYQIVSLFLLITYSLILLFRFANKQANGGQVIWYRWQTLLYAAVITNFVVSMTGFKA